jgi:protein-tyrosine phosphatase
MPYSVQRRRRPLIRGNSIAVNAIVSDGCLSPACTKKDLEVIESLLLVCTGNICRSALAEGMFKQARPSLRTMSAGLDAVSGYSPPEEAIDLARAAGFTIDSHRAQDIQSWMCRHFDLILVMESSQKHELEDRFPFTRGKVFRILENEGADLVDPYKRGLEAFKVAFDDLSRGVAWWLENLNRLTVATNPT